MNNKILMISVLSVLVLAGAAVFAVSAADSDAVDVSSLGDAEEINVNVNADNKAALNFTVMLTGPQESTGEVTNELKWKACTATVDAEVRSGTGLTSVPTISGLTLTTLTVTQAADNTSVYKSVFTINATNFSTSASITLAAEITSTLDSGNSVVQYKLFQINLVDTTKVATANVKFVDNNNVAPAASASNFAVKNGDSIDISLSIDNVTGKWYAVGLPVGLTMGTDGRITGIVKDTEAVHNVYVTVYGTDMKTYTNTFTFTVSANDAKVTLDISALTISNQPSIIDSTVSYGSTVVPRYLVKDGNTVGFTVTATGLNANTSVDLVWEMNNGSSSVKNMGTLTSGNNTAAIELTTADGAGEYLLKAYLSGGASSDNVMYVISVIVIEEVNYANAGIQFDMSAVSKS